MRNIPTFPVMLLLAFSLISCQKELSFESPSPGNNKPASLLGVWKFNELTTAVESGTSFDYGGVPGRIVATYATTTLNNKGILTITADKMETTNLGYAIVTDVKVKAYAGGILVDEQEDHIDFELPSSSASSDYQQIGSDSLYFPNGSIFDIPDTNGQQLPGASEPFGARYAISGDTLFIQSALNRSAITIQNGVEYEITQKVDGVSSFIRQ
ncbi:hypothetical protein [Agriterribacter sp.]|uniref:hypothetical protein n=1 Tax=Agriterribacter sp. TaxID=2821509 RepID=UPI002C6B8B1A|nr:hypothetical protein [Agriterribacter sp.]HRP55377.1 hypothetical protein [Agriterribacter sp.]